MRRKPNLKATADLTDCLRLRTSTASDDLVAWLVFFNIGSPNQVRSLTAAEDRATATKNVGRKPGAPNWITQRQRP